MLNGRCRGIEELQQSRDNLHKKIKGATGIWKQSSSLFVEGKHGKTADHKKSNKQYKE